MPCKFCKNLHGKQSLEHVCISMEYNHWIYNDPCQYNNEYPKDTLDKTFCSVVDQGSKI